MRLSLIDWAILALGTLTIFAALLVVMTAPSLATLLQHH
jgi:hypothetical protein